ncbi:copper homeostasis protein CutC [Anaerocolumna jejuensis]|uniref:copper homeostasis protein CutC n=1 Tax=Anaerocolumna jejuensis TaxID=259063 RepID=UPI003F7BDC27
MKNQILECCVDSLESALNAQSGRADRLELCQNLIIGGTTPSQSLFEEVKKHADIKIHVLIRPRYGDFCYSDYEIEMIRRDIYLFSELGADGVVIGALNPDGTLNLPAMRMFIKEAAGMSVTLHRAFDMCKEPLDTLEAAIALKINTILTSGHENNCMKGASMLQKLVQQADGRIDILAGGGVDAEVIKKLYSITGCTSYHMSGKCVLQSKMQYRNPKVNMGLPFLSEYEIYQTDEGKICAARQVLDSLK